jgi:hypothetical protein
VGDVASGAPRGAERTASPPRAVCESQIARGPAKALAGASTVGLLAAAGPAAPGLDSPEYLPIRAKARCILRVYRRAVSRAIFRV